VKRLLTIALPLLLLAACGASNSGEWQLAKADGWDGGEGFSLRLPPGWELHELQGIDSYVGEIVGDDVRLIFDYGSYSDTLAPEDDPGHEVIFEDVGGLEAKLVRPSAGSDGITGVYFADINGRRLSIAGGNLTQEQQDTAFAMFRTIEALPPSVGGPSTDTASPYSPTPLPSLDMFRLTVTAEPPKGFAPLSVQLIAEITGGPDSSPELHCKTREWTFGDGVRSVAMPDCPDWTPEMKMPRSFATEYRYDVAGIYEVSFSYGPLKRTISLEVK
jgi:hypothetical protein